VNGGRLIVVIVVKSQTTDITITSATAATSIIKMTISKMAINSACGIIKPVFSFLPFFLIHPLVFKTPPLIEAVFLFFIPASVVTFFFVIIIDACEMSVVA
jgi:hypothetical protein